MDFPSHSTQEISLQTLGYDPIEGSRLHGLCWRLQVAATMSRDPAFHVGVSLASSDKERTEWGGQPNPGVFSTTTIFPLTCKKSSLFGQRGIAIKPKWRIPGLDRKPRKPSTTFGSPKFETMCTSGVWFWCSPVVESKEKSKANHEEPLVLLGKRIAEGTLAWGFSSKPEESGMPA